MSLIIPLIVQIALLIGGWKLWRWSKKSEKASKTAWRRRFTALFFVSPMLLWILGAIFKDNAIIQAISFLSTNLDKGVDWLVGSAQEAAKSVGAIGALAVKPVIHSVVYAILGALLGWPLDRLKAKGEGEESGTDSADA